jgi:putative transposase
MLRDMLKACGHDVSRKLVATLMRRMGIEALYRKPNTSRKHPAHQVYPYLLRGLAIERANQVWAMDLTYIPMARGFVYLAAIIDLAQPQGAGLGRVHLDGSRLLRARARCSAQAPRQA